MTIAEFLAALRRFREAGFIPFLKIPHPYGKRRAEIRLSLEGVEYDPITAVCFMWGFGTHHPVAAVRASHLLGLNSRVREQLVNATDQPLGDEQDLRREILEILELQEDEFFTKILASYKT